MQNVITELMDTISTDRDTDHQDLLQIFPVGPQEFHAQLHVAVEAQIHKECQGRRRALSQHCGNGPLRPRPASVRPAGRKSK